MPFNPTDHPICLSYPLRTAPSAWMQHVPFAMLLIDLVRPEQFVELGTFRGTSYCAFCQAIQTLDVGSRAFAIDNWEGDEHGGFYGEEILDDLQGFHDPRYGSFSTLIKSSFDDAQPGFADGSIDLLHIDGYHTYDAVRHDFENWLPKMSQRGVVVLHDVSERAGDFGVYKFWAELKQRYPHFELFHGHGLGLVAVGTEIPEGLRPLLELSAERAGAVREFLYALGRGIESSTRVDLLEEHVRFVETQAQGRIERAEAQQKELVAAAREELAAAQAEQEELVAAAREELAAVQADLAEAQEQASASLELGDGVVQRHEAAVEALQRQLAETTGRLNATQWELNWLNSSRGVKAVRLARASRAVLKHKGPAALARHGGAWLLGKRGYYLRDIPLNGQLNAGGRASGTAATSQASDPGSRIDRRLVVSQKLPTDGDFHGVSVVILSYNGLDFVKACVESVYRYGCNKPFEVIVVDNGSSEDLKTWVKDEAERRESFYYISLKENIGFPKGLNVGIHYARGQYLALLNNDTVMTPGWLDELIAVADSDPAIGIVSPMTNYVGHGPQKDLLAANLPVEDAAAYAKTITRRERVQYVPDRLVFFAVLVKRQVVDVLGVLDEGFGKGNYEDDDYCARARIAGFKLAIARRAFIYHNHGSRTWNSSPDLNHTVNMEHNKMRFLASLGRHATTLAPTALYSRRTERVEVPEVSVVVRTVNRPETLKIALTSLANQTFESFEVVIVNDGGPDLTAVLEPFRRFLIIREVRHETPQGRTAALNTGVTSSRGKWVTFLDDDDVVYPLHLELMWDSAQSSPPDCAFVYSDYMRTLVAGTPPHLTTVARVPLGTWEFSRDELLVGNHIPIHCWFVRRDVAIEVGLFDTSMDMLEDWDFLIRLGLRHTFYPTRRISCEYRFYLNASNSLVWNRKNALEGLESIYKRYPAPSAACRAARDLEMTGLRRQVSEADKLKMLEESGRISAAEAARKVLTLTAGL